MLRRPHTRTVARLVLLGVAVLIVVHGLTGPQIAPRNLSSVLTWVHYRGLLIGALLLAGNLFCGACPMVLVRDVARRWRRPTWRWPRWLGQKWVAVVLFAAVLFGYELFDLWALPAATAWLLIGYFGTAVIVDLTFSGAAFCKHVCPVGQFSFVASTLSPLEVQVRETSVCASCRTADCINGREIPGPRGPIERRGCELDLFLPAKVGNLDCTFCLDCVHACPHDNVTLGVRVPGDELADDRRRSAIGRLSTRRDLAALVLLFTFGALVNALAMTAPAYAAEQWIARTAGVSSEPIALTILFLAGLVIAPLLLTAGAAGVTRGLAPHGPRSVADTAVSFAYALVPVGAGVWLAHYGFHFATAAMTLVPVVQGAALEWSGWAILGEPDWRWMGLRPGAVVPLEMGVVILGAMGSLVIASRIGERDHPGAGGRAAAPWAVLIVGLTAFALWILSQPMEMRGTELGP